MRLSLHQAFKPFKGFKSFKPSPDRCDPDTVEFGIQARKAEDLRSLRFRFD